jgi:membrane-bound serine protease (ClpP class)
MRKSLPLPGLLLLLLFLCLPFHLAAAQSQVPVEQNAIWVLKIDDAIGPAISDYLVRSFDKAANHDAEVIILEMDTPGGLDTSMRDIIQAILASRIPVVTFVYPAGARAASAGTYILYASHLAAMSPATNLGAATPIQIGLPSMPTSKPETDETQSPRQGESALELKMVNDAVAFIRGLAELRGRNADWAESAVREATSLTATAALKENVIDLIAKDVDDLLTQIDGKVVTVAGREITLQTSGRPIQLEFPDWRTRFLKVITNPNLVLILGMIGFYGLILEFYNPGFGVPGVIGIICLLLAGYALQMLPVNYAGVAFILLGVGLIIAEAMVPSFGILGFGGIVAFTMGAVILIDTDISAFRVGLPIIAATGLVSLGFIFITINLAMKIRHKPVVIGAETMIGKTGIAFTDVADSGQVKVQGELWNAVADYPIKKGDVIRVTSINGLQLGIEKGETTDG